MTFDMDDFLEHHGIKGMKWGVRNTDRAPGVSRKVDKEASKDAKEFARAREFHGQGAGTRRKLINHKVEARTKQDPTYKQAFDHHLARQDQAKHVEKAISERKRIDRTTKTKQTAGAVARRFTGEMGTQAAFTAVALGGAAFLASPKGRRVMNKVVSTVTNSGSSIINSQRQRQGAAFLTDYFARNG